MNDVKLKGAYQLKNFKVALKLSEELLKDEFNKIKVAKGIAETYWPARYEKISDTPIIIRDVAHNPEGMNALKNNLLSDYQNYKKIVVFSVMRDKDYIKMLKIIDDFSDFNIFTQADNIRVLSSEILIKNSTKPALSVPKPEEAIKIALKKASKYKESLIVITGSIFLMSQIEDSILRRSLL